jgi:hypothetical protein
MYAGRYTDLCGRRRVFRRAGMLGRRLWLGLVRVRNGVVGVVLGANTERNDIGIERGVQQHDDVQWDRVVLLQ